MARLRKAPRSWWRDPDAQNAAARLTVAADTSYFTIEPRLVFGREAPLEIEIGAGRGDFIIERAAMAPHCNFLAIEIAGAVAQLLALRAGRRELSNLRVACMDARTLVNLMLPERSVSAYHIYFPDPWPKARHAKHRLFTPYFVRNLHRTLTAGAPLYVASDVYPYAEVIFTTIEANDFRRAELDVPGASNTGFARKFIADGRQIYAGTFIKERAKHAEAT
jgi:tRNA (guanine-N7-)-methyltransferase